MSIITDDLHIASTRLFKLFDLKNIIRYLKNVDYKRLSAV